MRREGHYTIQVVDRLPKQGNANRAYVIEGDPIEVFYFWMINSKTYRTVNIGGDNGLDAAEIQALIDASQIPQDLIIAALQADVDQNKLGSDAADTINATAILAEQTARIAADELKEDKIDSTGFATTGSENSLGINTTDDTAQKIFDKLDTYVVTGGNFLENVTDFTELATLTPELNDWAYVDNASTGALGIESPAGEWYWDGTSWKIIQEEKEDLEFTLKDTKCYIDFTPPASDAGVTISANDDLEQDDIFTSVQNTTANDITLTTIELVAGTWSTANNVSVIIDGQTIVVPFPATATGNTFTFALTTAITIPSGGSVNVQIQAAPPFGSPLQIVSASALLGNQFERVFRTYSDGTTERIFEFSATTGLRAETASLPTGLTGCPVPEDKTLFSTDLVLSEPRLHDVGEGNDLRFTSFNSAGSRTSDLRWDDSGFAARYFGFEADGVTTAGSTEFDVNSTSISMDFGLDTKLGINGFTGSPKMMVASQGESVANAPKWMHQNLVDIVDERDFTNNEPILGAAESGNTWYNTGTGVDANGTAFVPGFITMRSDPDGLTISNFIFEAQTEPVAAYRRDTEQICHLVGGALVCGEELDLCGINEFIHNIADYHLVLAHEGTSGNTKIVNVSGTPATFENLENATDNGAGGIVFAGGTNQNWNRSGNTVETVRNIGDYFEIVAGSTGQFDTQAMQLSTDPLIDAENFASGNVILTWTATVYNLNIDGVSVSSAVSEVGTYRFTRTLYGWSVTRNGINIYESPEVCNNYSIPEISADSNNDLELREDGLYVESKTVEGATGYYQLGKDVSNAATELLVSIPTNIITGFDFTQASGMDFVISVTDRADVANILQPWSDAKISVDQMLIAYNDGQDIDGYMAIFDNDWIRINIIDPVTGELELTATGRSFVYQKSELWITAPNANPLFLVRDDVAITTTGTFVDYGITDDRITGQDGDIVHLEYGDFNRDTFVFFDGIARAERKGFSTNDTELRVLNNTLQIKDTGSGESGITKIWYKQHINAGVIAVSANVDANIHEEISTWNLLTAPAPVESNVDNVVSTILEDNSATVVSGYQSGTDYLTPTTGETQIVRICIAKESSQNHYFLLRHSRSGVAGDASLRVDTAGFIASEVGGGGLPELIYQREDDRSIEYAVRFFGISGLTEWTIHPYWRDNAGTISTTGTGTVEILEFESIDNPAPITQVNDQAANGYLDIGNMRMQWGVITHPVNTGSVTVTFPEPFLTSSVPNVTSTSLVNALNSSIGGLPTATSFSSRHHNGATGAGGDVMWQAIGLRP